MTSEEKLQSLLDTHCTCSLCRDVFKQPRMLTCFHTFCTPCLESYIAQKVCENGQKSFPCPTCSAQIIVAGENKDDAHLEVKVDQFTSKLVEIVDAFRSEKSCDICKRGEIGLSVPALDWCMECYDALCEGCVKIHLCGKTTSDHTVLSLEELKKLSIENVMKRNITQKCIKHEEDIKMYCLDCKDPVCVQCFASTHRKCEHCVLISEASKSLNEDVAELISKLHSFKDKCSDVVPTNETSAEILLKSSLQRAEEEIRALANELRQKIDMHEKIVLEQLHSLGDQLQLKITDSMKTPEIPVEEEMKVLSSAEVRLAALLKYGCDGEVLEVYNHIKETLAKIEKQNTPDNSENEVRLKVKFDTDSMVKTFCRDFEKLGDIRVEDCNTDNGFSSWGVTVTSREEIILADCRNRRVQKFSSSGDLMDHIVLNEEPRDVTCFGEDNIALTLLKKHIYIVTLSGTMALKRKYETVKQYDGIVYSPANFCFLVSSVEDRCIDLVSRQGDITKTFKFNSAGEPLFEIPRYVAVSKDGFYIISDAGKSAVMCMSQDGSVVFSYSPSEANELKRAQGVCSDKIGNLFVADYANSRVHLLTSDGNFQRFVLGRESGLRRPVALAMTQSNKLVIIQSDGVVKIFSYESAEVLPKPKPKNLPPVRESNDDGEDSETPVVSNSAFGTRRLSSYTGLGGGISYAKMFGNPGAIHSGGTGYKSYRRHSENVDPRSPTAPAPFLPQSLRPRNF